jgi:hypothetical protein
MYSHTHYCSISDSYNQIQAKTINTELPDKEDEKNMTQLVILSRMAIHPLLIFALAYASGRGTVVNFIINIGCYL